MMLTDLFSLLSYTPQDCVHRNGSDQSRLDYSTTGISGENVPVDVRQVHLKVKFVSNEVPLYQRTLACVKLTKKKKDRKTT